MKKLLIALCATLVCDSLWADSLLITDAKLYDPATENPIDILVVDGFIEAIGENLDQENADQVIDAAGRPVTPALFAGITATGLSEVGMVRESVDARLNGLYTGLMHPEFDVREAFNPHSSIVPVTRIEGYGYALLAAGSGDRTLSGQGSLVRFDGGFDSFEGHQVLYANVDGYSARETGGSRAAHWMLLEAAFEEVSRADADLTLISSAGKQVLKNSRKNALYVFHANRAADIHRVIEFAARHRLRAVIAGGQEAWIVRDALAGAGIPVVLNALDNLPGSFDALGARLDNAALLNQAGVTVLFTSGETQNARKVRQVAGSAVAHGLPHDVALAAMTSTPAAIFGGAERSVSVGARADLVIWSGDPLEVNTAADQVIIDGQLDPMVSRQSLLLERYLQESPAFGRAYSRH